MRGGAEKRKRRRGGSHRPPPFLKKKKKEGCGWRACGGPSADTGSSMRNGKERWSLAFMKVS